MATPGASIRPNRDRPHSGLNAVLTAFRRAWACAPHGRGRIAMDALLDSRTAPADAGKPAGPLMPAPIFPGVAERRAQVRWRTPDVNARLHLGDATFPCRMRDISAGGAGLLPDFTATIGTPAVLELSPRMSLPGYVVRVARDAIGIR